MNINTAFHHSAMEMNTFADVFKAKGYPQQAKEFYKMAFEMEKKSAMLSASNDDGPIPYLVLIRSAAALAYHAGMYEESEKMIEWCMSENPPQWLENELFELKKLIGEDNVVVEKIERTKIEGILTNVISEENTITVKDLGYAQNFAIIVPKKIFQKIVKKHWSKKVTVEARKTLHGIMVLEKITAAA